MFLGIDLGTGSVKVMLLGARLQVLNEVSEPYENRSPQPGWAEIDPNSWWSATVAAVHRCVGNRADRVRAIGLSGQSHSLVLAGADGQPVRPAVLWYDRRATEEVREVSAMDPALLRQLANPLVPGMSLFTLMWLQRHEPESVTAARFALGAKDWLRLQLTGEALSEPSDASATLLYDLESNAWHRPLIRALGLPERLMPPIVPSGADCARLGAAAARALGLPAGVPVAAGAADAAAALVGLGVTRPGQAVLQVGTGVQIMTVCEAPAFEPQPTCNTFRGAGRYYFRMAAMLNGGTALSWAQRALDCDLDEMYRLAFERASGDSDVIFVPYVNGERTPHLDPNASGAWIGLRVDTGRAELARAVFEGIAFAIRDGWNALRQHTADPHSLLLTGGGSADPRWRQLLADTLGMPLRISRVRGASARGAAILGACACGLLGDPEDLTPVDAEDELVEPRARPLLDARYHRCQDLYRRLNAA